MRRRNHTERSRGSIGIHLCLLVTAAFLTAPCTALYGAEQYSLRFQGATQAAVYAGSDVAFYPAGVGHVAPRITTASGDFVAQGFRPDMIARITGSASNNGLFRISAATAGTLYLNRLDRLTMEAAGAAVTVASADRPRVEFPDETAFDVVIDSGASAADRRILSYTALEFRDNDLDPDTIEIAAGNFEDDGLADGMTIAISGAGLGVNNGLHTIEHVSPTVLTLSAADRLATESVAAATFVTASPGLTVETWVRFDDYEDGAFPPKWQAIATKGRSWGLSRYLNTNRVTFSTWTGTQYDDLISSTELQPDTWYHLAAVYDGATKRLYIDGVLNAEQDWAGPLNVNDENLMIGDSPTIAGDSRLRGQRNFKGYLDCTRVWCLARSAAEIPATMARRLRGSEPGLLGAWRFDEDPGDPVAAAQALDSTEPPQHHGVLRDLDPVASRVKGSDTSVTPPSPYAVLLGSALPGAYALRLDSSLSQYVRVSNEMIFDFSVGMTAELWVRFDEIPAAEAALISKGGGAWELIVVPDTTDPTKGRIRFVSYHPGTTYVLESNSTVEVADPDADDPMDGWYHVAAVFDGVARYLLINGNIDNSDYTATGSLVNNDLPVCFGARPLAGGGATAFLGATIDEVRLWQRARPLPFIARDRLRDLTGHEPHLAGIWSFDEGDGPVAVDSKQIILKPDSVVTLQFEYLAHDGNQIRRFSSNYREQSGPGVSNPGWVDPEGDRDDDFLVQATTAAPDTLATKGADMPDAPDSTALFNTIPETDTLLTLTDPADPTNPAANRHFRILSIEVADLNGSSAAGTQVTFRGRVYGETVERTITLDGGDTNLEFVEFERFNNVDELRWMQSPDYHQFDNITLQMLEDLQPHHLKADGFLVNIPDYNRIDSDLQFGQAAAAQYALEFDGDGEWLQVDIPVGDDPLDMTDALGSPVAFTLEAWIKPAAFPPAPAAPGDPETFHTLVRKGDVGYGLALDSDGNLCYWIDDSPEASLRSTRSVLKHVWQHVAVTVSPGTNTVAFYINGRPAGDHESNAVPTDIGPLVVSRQGATIPAGYYEGCLDELRVWDHARSAEEIAFFAGRQLPGGLTGLIAYWPLNDGLGNWGMDAAGGGLDAELRAHDDADFPDWIYGPGAPIREGMYALEFDGVDDYLRVPHYDELGHDPPGLLDITIEAWICPESKSDTPDDGSEDFRTILMKGDNVADTGAPPDPVSPRGYGFGIDWNNFLCFWSVPDGATSVQPTHIFRSDDKVTDGEWQHVAVVISGGYARFYIDGQSAGQDGNPGGREPQVNVNEEDLFIGRQGLTTRTARQHYKGKIDELRIWDRAQSADDILRLASRQLFHPVPHLVAYFSLNDFDPENSLKAANGAGLPLGEETGGLAFFGPDMGITAWVNGLYSLDWDGPFWDEPYLDPNLNLARNAAAKGLWVGKVVLSKVNEVQTAKPGESGEVTDTADTASFTILFHVDDGGRVSLLKDVIIMQEEDGEEDTSIAPDALADGVSNRLVLLTDPSKIPLFRGVTIRGGKLVGQRIGTVAYDFENAELAMDGGLGPGRAVVGELVLPKLHPTNPFRHKYHPDHRNTNPDNENYGYQIVRHMTVVFDDTPDGQPDVGDYGVRTLTGAYTETVEGLHKVPLVVEGTVALTRICTVGKLNE